MIEDNSILKWISCVTPPIMKIIDYISLRRMYVCDDRCTSEIASSLIKRLFISPCQMSLMIYVWMVVR